LRLFYWALISATLISIILIPYNLEGKITDCWLVATEGIFFLIFVLTKPKLLTPDKPSAQNTCICLAEGESAPFALSGRVLKWKQLELDFGLNCLTRGYRLRVKMLPSWLAKMVWKSGDSSKRNSRQWTWMFYGKQQMVICFKTTENIG